MKETPMDYERIEKPQGGGFSPAKLRSMLLGIEKKRKEEEQIESKFSLRSELNEIDDRGLSTSENCKDVDIVSELPGCSNSLTVMETLASDMSTDRRLKEHNIVNSRIRSQEDGSLDYDSGYDSASMSSAAFEFQKAERAAPHRVPFASITKPAPSKWDDAQKWIASPTSNRTKSGQSQAGSRKTGFLGYGRQSSMKVVTEVPEQRSVALDEADTKRIDPSQQGKKEVGEQKFVNWAPDPHPVADLYAKPAVLIESSVADSAISLSRHDPSISVHSATTFIPPPSTVRSVSMRDMGTEMTPIASQEPSRTGTPVRATTPIRSPTSSRPSTPGRAPPVLSPVEAADCQLDANKKELSEKELQKKTRREIMALGAQLGKMNIAAWASKEEEDKDASTSLKTVGKDHVAKSVIEIRAAAWEEAEKAKYMARYKREEIKIEAWENHQKAKTEAEMRKIEVEVERMRAQAHDKLMNKLAATRHKAEEKRAVAEAKRNRQAAKTEQQAEYIRRTGRIPSSFSCCSWCS
ncbi:Remorin [Macleaya cordata]|uniref:Remorin n=1 Tax=Macleaya cordata TaxID=56857 RepID=A0A200QBN3_MACCD|nr:Remorin [Macleaya cordata]